MRRIGVLMLYPENDPEGQLRATAFRQGHQELGWVVGRNVQIDIQWDWATRIGCDPPPRSCCGDAPPSADDACIAFAAASGGLLSYGFDLPNVFRQAAVEADRILLSDLPQFGCPTVSDLRADEMLD